MNQVVETNAIFCSQCGKRGSADARFCNACGHDMSGGLQQTATAPIGRIERMGHMGDGGEHVEVDASNDGNIMSLSKAWVIYLAALLIWMLVIAIPKVPLGSIVYLIIGFVMTRFVMRGLVEFHPVYNTVANVFSAKIWMFFLWPVTMLILLIKLSINKVL